MTINIQYEKIPFSEPMTKYVIESLSNLGKKYHLIEKAKVFFKSENDLSGMEKICEIELSMPGPNVFASSRENNFELAAKESTLEIERQLQKIKAEFWAH